MASVWTGELPRIAEDVFWQHVEQVGQEACEEAVLAYFDRSTVTKILMEHIDAEDLEEYFNINLLSDEQVNHPTSSSLGDFLQELEQYKSPLEDRQGERIDWLREGL